MSMIRAYLQNINFSIGSSNGNSYYRHTAVKKARSYSLADFAKLWRGEEVEVAPGEFEFWDDDEEES